MTQDLKLLNLCQDVQEAELAMGDLVPAEVVSDRVLIQVVRLTEPEQKLWLRRVVG